MGYIFSLHKSGGWKGQLRRIERWHRRLTEAAQIGSDDLEDFSYAFFQNAFHLRDWLVKDFPHLKRNIEAAFSANNELGVCRDIANATKHFKIDRRASVDTNISIAREYDPRAPNKTRLTVLADVQYDLISLANECLDKITKMCVKINTEHTLDGNL